MATETTAGLTLNSHWATSEDEAVVKYYDMSALRNVEI
jgi:hypothetical protein